MARSAWIEIAPGRRRLIKDIDAYLADHEARRARRADMPTPNLIRDGIDPIISHADGKMYDSYSAYKHGIKEVNRRTGKQYEIVGDKDAFRDAKPPEWKPDPNDVKKDLKDAWDRVVGV